MSRILLKSALPSIQRRMSNRSLGRIGLLKQVGFCAIFGVEQETVSSSDLPTNALLGPCRPLRRSCATLHPQRIKSPSFREWDFHHRDEEPCKGVITNHDLTLSSLLTPVIRSSSLHLGGTLFPYRLTRFLRFPFAIPHRLRSFVLHVAYVVG